MSRDPYERYEGGATDQERRHRREVRARKRQKRLAQRIILFAALALAAALVIFCVVMIIRAIFAPKTPAGSQPPGAGTSQASGVEPAGSGTPVDPADSVPPANNPQPGVDYPVAVDTSVWNLILVNGQHPLPSGYKVADDDLSSIVAGGTAYWFDNRIINELNEMMRACNEATGGSLHVVAGYRAEQYANARYNEAVARVGEEAARKLEPPAGYSEHQTGLAVDFGTGSDVAPNAGFANTAEYNWLLENAASYGFILRYSAEKEAITGMSNQPYHFRYVGVTDAQSIKGTEATLGVQICLEEYLAAVPGGQDAG